MKITELIAWSAVAAFAVLSAQAQGNFQNLNFERANPIFVSNSFYFGAVTAASALPFWSVYYGSVQQTQIEYNVESTGALQVSLVSATNSLVPAIDGNYSVLLQGTGTPLAASLSQTGLIPASTQSLLFEASPAGDAGFPGPLELLVGTQVVPFTAVGTGANYTLYSADVSA